jgi:GNAT superfamily N-acetyltransferase
MHITTDKTALDIALIHDFLSTTSPWAQGIPLETVQRSIEHSLCFGGFIDGKQIAFARVVTDHATFAYLMDVFVLPDFRGQGHSRRLLEVIQDHPDLQNIRRFILELISSIGMSASKAIRDAVQGVVAQLRLVP